jgi:hypothetical protein
MLCQFQSLRLVIRADALAVEPAGSGEHTFIDQATDNLTMLENEWHLARTHFKHGARAVTAGTRVAEARIEEPGITVLSRCSLCVCGWAHCPLSASNPLKLPILLATAVSLSLHGAVTNGRGHPGASPKLLSASATSSSFVSMYGAAPPQRSANWLSRITRDCSASDVH